MKTSIFKRALQATLVMAMTAALLLGTSLAVNAGIALFPPSNPSISVGTQNGVTATARVEGGNMTVTVPNFVTVEFEGRTNESGIFRVGLTGDFDGPDQIRYFRSQAGEELSDLSFTVTVTPARLITDLAVTFDFFPDLHGTFVDGGGNPLGITATGEVSIMPAPNTYMVAVTLNGQARASGSYIVYISHSDGADFIQVNPGPQMFAYSRNQRAGAFDTVRFVVTLETGGIDDLQLELAYFPNPLYIIDYIGEYILFDEEVLFTVVTNTERFQDIANSGANQFGPRFERNWERARWNPTLNGRIDISRAIPRRERVGRTVSIAVRRVNAPNAEPVFITLPTRPDIRPHRNLRREIYCVTTTAFRNNTPVDMEIRFDFDRSANNAHVHVLRAAGCDDGFDVLNYHPDRKPSGVRGNFRIAAQGFEMFIFCEITNQFRELTEYELAAARANASFASMPVRFTTRAQRNAPNTTRMELAPWRQARVAGVNIYVPVITRTTNRMVVRVGTNTETGQPVYSDVLDRTRMPLERFDALFNVARDSDYIELGKVVVDRNVNGYPVPHYRFEIRLPATHNRVISRPGFLFIPVEQYNNTLNPPPVCGENDYECGLADCELCFPPSPVLPNLVSITAPASINKTFEAAEAASYVNDWSPYLPTTVAIVTYPADVTTASVTWDVSNVIFDPTATDEQAITVNGTVSIPDTVSNTDDVSLYVTITIDIAAPY